MNVQTLIKLQQEKKNSPEKKEDFQKWSARAIGAEEWRFSGRGMGGLYGRKGRGLRNKRFAEHA